MITTPAKSQLIGECLKVPVRSFYSNNNVFYIDSHQIILGQLSCCWLFQAPMASLHHRRNPDWLPSKEEVVDDWPFGKYKRIVIGVRPIQHNPAQDWSMGATKASVIVKQCQRLDVCLGYEHRLSWHGVFYTVAWIYNNTLLGGDCKNKLNHVQTSELIHFNNSWL